MNKSEKDIIDSYQERWGLKKGEDHHVKDHTYSKDFPTDAEVGDTWTDPSTDIKYKKIGDDTWTVDSKKKGFSTRQCECGKFMKSQNEITTYLQTGRCFTCHAKEETRKILEGAEYEPPAWKKQILFKDSFGNIVMDINDLRSQYGNLVAHGVLLGVYESMQKIDESKRNNVLFQSIKEEMEKIEEIEGEIDHDKVRDEISLVKKELGRKKNEEIKQKI